MAAAASCGDKFRATSPHEFVRVVNGAGAPITVTIPTVRRAWAAPVNSVLTGSASAAQAVVNVTDGTKFSAGMLCTLVDSAARERVTVLSVLSNAVTLTKNIATTGGFTTGRGAVLWVGGADIVVTVAAIGSAPANDITIAFDSTAPLSDFTDDDGYVNITYSAVTTVTVGLFEAF